MPGNPQSEKVLLVEGADDLHVVAHLCRRQPPMPEFGILDKRGFPKLADTIGTEINAPGRRAVGILVDANDDPAARWQAISHRLREAGCNPPRQPAEGGTILDGRPRVGVWLMPDNQAAGELEDFIERLVPDSDPVWPRACEYIDGIPPADRRFPAGKIQRARIHAWLATRQEPRKMGGAIGAGDLDAAAPRAAAFAAWLRRLFRI